MPKATSSSTTTAPPIISGASAISIADTITRLKQIAVVSQDHLCLSDGPVHPDHELLGLCAEALHWAVEYRKVYELRRGDIKRGQWGRNDELCEQEFEAEKQMNHFCRKVRKLPAKTPAGLFAKATLCRAHKIGAGVLAMSMADDFLACDEIRLAIWKPEAVQ